MLTEQCATPADADTFCGRLRRVDLGDIRLAEISASASTVARTRTHIARANDAPFVFRYLLSGELHSTQDGVEITQKPGDFALYDTSRPYRLTLRDDTALLSIRIPKVRLLRHIPYPEGHHFPGGVGRVRCRMPDVALCASSVRFLAPRGCRRGATDCGHRASADRELVRDVARATARIGRPSLRDIVSHSQHREKSSRTVAIAKLPLPRRCVSRQAMPIGSFRKARSRLAASSLRRRLERCHDALSDRVQAGRTITHIAFAFGFASIAHFSRVFRERYSHSARVPGFIAPGSRKVTISRVSITAAPRRRVRGYSPLSVKFRGTDR